MKAMRGVKPSWRTSRAVWQAISTNSSAAGIQAGQPNVLTSQCVAADQDRLAEALALERVGGADHGRLLALGEDDLLLRTGLHRPGNLLQEARGRIEPARQALAVGVHVG